MDEGGSVARVPEKASSSNLSSEPDLLSRISPRMMWAVLLLILVASIAIGILEYAVSPIPINDRLFSTINITTEVLRATCAISVFGVVWLTRRFSLDRRTLSIGTSFLAVGVLTIFRLLTFPGMPSMGGLTENVNHSLYFSKILRCTVGAGLLLSVFSTSLSPVTRRECWRFLSATAAYFTLATVLILAPQSPLPELQGSGTNLHTGFVALEICAMILSYAAAFGYAWMGAKARDGRYVLVSIGLILFAQAGFSFTTSPSNDDGVFLIGRATALVGFFLVFLAVMKTSLYYPYAKLDKAMDDLLQTKNEVERKTEEMKVLAQDLMERRLAEEALAESNRELEAFSYSVSHDLRTPLRSISGFSTMLADRYSSALDEKGKDYIDRIRSSCEHMGLLIDDILKLSRITRAEMTWEKVDLSKIAREVLADLKKAQPERSVKIVVREDLVVRGDERLYRILMTNLLDNAWKFTQKQAWPIIEFGATVINGERVFFVKDNGAGFEMEYADKLFVPFQRLHSSLEFAGTGIGLATAQRILKKHGGRIWAEAEVGKGATFYFTEGRRELTRGEQA